jgi:hypothetical protein
MFYIGSFSSKTSMSSGLMSVEASVVPEDINESPPWCRWTASSAPNGGARTRRRSSTRCGRPSSTTLRIGAAVGKASTPSLDTFEVRWRPAARAFKLSPSPSGTGSTRGVGKRRTRTGTRGRGRHRGQSHFFHAAKSCCFCCSSLCGCGEEQ